MGTLTSARYVQNRDLWYKQLPDGAARLPEDAAPPAPKKARFHDEQGQAHALDDGAAAVLHSRQWLASLPLATGMVLLLYGVSAALGLDALDDFLADDENTLILLDDEVEPLAAFLDDPNAAGLLSRRNVWLFFIPNSAAQDATIEYLARSYYSRLHLLAAFPPYAKYKERRCQELHVSATLLWPESEALAKEVSTYFFGFTKNFYANLFELSDSRDAIGLKDALKDIPAIVCGAGPSLAHNRALLHGLQQHALLIAGGTATNALGADSIVPHLNVGLDPNIFFERRIASSTAWMAPFIYSFRMNNLALRRVYGEKFLLNLPHPDGLETWFFKELGLPHELLVSIDSKNVTHLCTLIALAMGCNPIIFVGVDLAYSGEASYAKGITTLATHRLDRDFITKHASEELLERKDIYGNPIKTLRKWIAEAVWYGALPARFPGRLFLNATEGGLGFPAVENVTLSAAIKKHCDKQEFVDGLLHAALQRCPPPSLVRQRL